MKALSRTGSKDGTVRVVQRDDASAERTGATPTPGFEELAAQKRQADGSSPAGRVYFTLGTISAVVSWVLFGYLFGAVAVFLGIMAHTQKHPQAWVPVVLGLVGIVGLFVRTTLQPELFVKPPF